MDIVLQMLFFSLILTVAGIILLLIFPYRIKSFLVFAVVLANAILTSIPAVNALIHNDFEFIITGFVFFGNISLRIDSLSAWFILIINIACINGVIYGIGYMNHYKNQKANLSLHWILFLVFQSSMLWVCIVQNSLTFLIVWEIMSLSSFLLVIFDHENSKTLKAGINYLVQMHIGVVLLTVAFIWVFLSERSFDFSAVKAFNSANSNIWLFILFFAGFGLKAGFIPLHSWLPHAHPAAPSHISGVMSGVIVKLGIYGIIRMITFLKSDFLILGEIILSLSVITGVYGIVNAAVHRDIKKMLAYCTVENIGIIGIGIGMGLIGIGRNNLVLMIAGFTGALLHTLNHSLFKSLLFFSAGAVYQQTHTKNMEKLGGLIKSMPQTAFLFLIGALAIGGLPPFNGFISEFILYKGILEGIHTSGLYHSILLTVSFAGLAIIGGLSLLTFTRSFGIVFLGSPRTTLKTVPVEVPLLMRIPQYVIVLIMISIGLFPSFYFKPAVDVITGLFPGIILNNTYTFTPFINALTGIGKYAAFFILLTIVVYLIRVVFTRKLINTVSTTWGCGYVAPKTKMQYTGKSFSKSAGKILGVIIFEKKKFRELTFREMFLAERKHSSRYVDFFENMIIKKINNRLLYFMNLFQFVQNGQTQMYIMYGLLFIILIFLGSLFNFI